MFLRKKVRKVVLALWALSACQTPETSQTKTADGPVQSKTILPQTFAAERDILRDAHIVVPKEMLKMSRINRPKAEVRSGPGIQFQLVDAMFSRDTLVYLFERVGVWQKVLEPTKRVSGWVHYRVLDEVTTNETVVSLDVTALPTVFAMVNIDKGYGFPERNELTVSIPKGTIFKSFKKTKFGTLVWLPQTNSVLWLSGEVVQ